MTADALVEIEDHRNLSADFHGRLLTARDSRAGRAAAQTEKGAENQGDSLRVEARRKELPMLFDDWSGIMRTVVVGTLAYAALVVLLRVSGKRTLAKMNAFDFVVTVALGSTLATILLSKDVALAEGVTAFLTLIGLQYAIAWAQVRSARVQRLVKSEPRLLLFEGRLLDDAMQAERVTREEVLAAIRSEGILSVEEAGAVVLETDGTFAVMKRSKGDASALRSVRSVPDGGGAGGTSA
jgi:uncharacterized membrane protein YcaP (DUF421 family)